MNWTLKEFWEDKIDWQNKNHNITYKNNNNFRGATYSAERTLWYDKGGTVIPLDDIKIYEELEKRCDEYIKGNLICCRCHKVINCTNDKEYERYWAGVYCKDCWSEKDEADREWEYSHLD